MVTPRKRVSLALSHKQPDRVPIGYSATPEVNNNLKKYLNINSDSELLKRLGVDYRMVFPDYVGPKDLLSEKDWSDLPGKDIWGVERRTVKNVYGEYREICKHPLKDVKDIEELERYPWPKTEWFDFASLEKQFEVLDEEDEYWVILSGASSFEQAWYLRGMEQFLMDLIVNPDIAYKIMEKIYEFSISRIIESIKATKDRIDMIWFCDDVASQSGMFMSVDTWRKMIKPWAKKYYKISHDYSKKTLYHCCGSLEPIIEDLIEVDLDALNPIQFSAKGFPEPEVLKERYGSRLCFEGGMDVQTVLPFCSAEDVKKETKKLIRILGKDGGYILQPSHNIQPDTPIENIMAMYDTALNYF